MKKLFLSVMIMLLGGGLLFAQNTIDVSGLKVEAGTVTFNVKWLDAGASNLWSDTVWVFVDYNKNGKMTRMLLEPGSTLTATSSPGVGKLVEENVKGAWVVGDARTNGSFSATVQLLTATADLFGACAYASSYPPVGQYVSESEIVFSGTPWYEIKLLHSDGYTVETIESGSTFLLPCSYTVSSFTDATGAPGIINCLKPANLTLATPFTTICAGQTVTLTASAGGAAQYRINDGLWQASPVFDVAPVSNASYTLYAQTEDGCVTSVANAAVVTVNPKPTGLTFVSTLATACEGESVTLVALPAGAASYNIGSGWQSSNTFTVPASATSYPLFVQTAAGCSNTIPNAVTVAVNPLPDNLTLTASPAAICNGQASTLTASATNGYEYSRDNSTWQTTTAFNVTPGANASYTLYVKTAAGCSATKTNAATVAVNPAPTNLIFTAAPAAICNGESTTLTASATNGYQYSRDNNTWQTTTKFNVTPGANASYTLYVKTAAGCSATKTNAATVTVNPLPTNLTLTASPAAICNGTSTTLTASATNGYEYSRDNSTWQTTTAFNVTPGANASYTLYVKTAAGCSATKTDAATVAVSQSSADGQAPDATCGCASGLSPCSGLCRSCCWPISGGISEASNVNYIPANRKHYDDAVAICAAMGTGWRLPTMDEANCMCYGANLVPGGLPPSNEFYWTTRVSGGLHYSKGCPGMTNNTKDHVAFAKCVK
jgi:hypothetical protein